LIVRAGWRRARILLRNESWEHVDLEATHEQAEMMTIIVDLNLTLALALSLALARVLLLMILLACRSGGNPRTS